MGFPKTKYQQITYTVSTDGQEIVIDAETDKLYNTCTGINILLTNETGKFSTIQLEINGVEIFPEKFEALRLLFRQHVAFGFDYHRLSEPANGSKIKGKYIDDSNASGYPYNITFSFRLENMEPASTETKDTGKVD